MTDPRIDIGGSAESKVAQMELAPYMRGTRGKTTLGVDIGIGTTVDVPIVFDKALPTASYSPQVTLEGTAGVLGQLSAIVKTGTLTLTGCTVSVKNSSLVTLGTNVIVHVTANY
jgi:hypothetical protein